MIAGISSRMLRSHTLTVGLRQQVVAHRNSALSKRVVRLTTLVLCVSLLAVFSLSQFLHWQITASAHRLDQLQSVRNNTGSENISLLAQRAQLASKDYVTEQVRTKFQLFVPGKEQVNRL